MKRLPKLFLALSFISLIQLPGFGQDQELTSEALRKSSISVFLDCRCDMNYIREEVPYINYVRDVKEAQVYVRMTSQRTASGGDQYTVAFQGLNEFSGMNDTLQYSSNPDETVAITRDAQVKVLKTGLMRYVAHTPIIREIQITHNSVFVAEEVTDRWNNWVFDLQTSPSFNLDETYESLNLRNSVTISKVTPDIKLELDFNHFFNRQKFIMGDAEKTYTRKSENVGLLFVKSLGEHWSAGVRWNLSASTQINYDLNNDLMPAIEYDLFPYSEATHRQLRILYSAGYRFSNYIDTSWYNYIKENRPRQELSIGYMVQEKWGSINLSLTGASFLHDLSKNSLEVGGSVRLRLFKGLSLNISGNAAYIGDQLNLAKGELSEAERLLRLKQQATSFDLGGSVGLNYTFGSIYNNVVNPRFNSFNFRF